MTIAKIMKAEVAVGGKVARRGRCYQGQGPAPCRLGQMASHMAENAAIGVGIARIAAAEGVVQIAAAVGDAAGDVAAIAAVEIGGDAGVPGEGVVGHRGQCAPSG